MTTIRANSSHGNFLFDPHTGQVSLLENLDEDFGDLPAVVNVWEWRNHYPGLEIPSDIDVLDIGYITETGQYVEPVEDWRQEAARQD